MISSNRNERKDSLEVPEIRFLSISLAEYSRSGVMNPEGGFVDGS